MLNKGFLPIAAAMAALFAPAANATIVQFQVAGLGNFEVNLYDQSTPATVANFLAYVNDGSYTNTVVHRGVNGFVVQGGGFTYQQGAQQLGNVAAKPAVVNEPKFSNVRGTIAMAKLGGNANSATNQWFINVGNNSANLDAQNGGFTVFGQVIGNGMDVIDAMNALPKFAFTSPFDTLPLRDYTAQNFNDGVAPTDRNFVIITAINVTDTTVNTAASLSPAPNTLITQTTTTPPTTSSGGGGGGGAVGLGSLLTLGLLSLLRRRRMGSRAAS
jgi:cyclophilin family peptidyl-prolyl cis-trans isomerase